MTDEEPAEPSLQAKGTWKKTRGPGYGRGVIHRVRDGLAVTIPDDMAGILGLEKGMIMDVILDGMGLMLRLRRGVGCSCMATGHRADCPGAMFDG